MGMFDDITCKYPLPIDGANDRVYQTKDTPNQFLDRYEIRKDGTLWVEEYDTEDRSRAALWRKEHPNEKEPEWNVLDKAIGCMAKINHRWVPVDFTGEIEFYDFWDTGSMKGWISWSSYFVEGKLKELHLLEHRIE